MKTIEIDQLKQMVAELVANQEKSRIENEKTKKENDRLLNELEARLEKSQNNFSARI